MDIKVDGAYFVELSECNARDLLAQYERHGAGALVRNIPDTGFLTVRVVSDEAHYGEREPGPGLYPHGTVPAEEL